MTYKELLSQLQQLPEDLLNCDVVICSEDEPDEYFQEGVELVFAGQEDNLGLDHPIIRF